MSFSSTDATRPRALVISGTGPALLTHLALVLMSNEAVTLTSDKPIKWVELRLLANNESIIHQKEQRPHSTRATFEIPRYGPFRGLLLLVVDYFTEIYPWLLDQHCI